MVRFIKIARDWAIIFIAWAVFILVMSDSRADIKDYRNPFICKPIVSNTDGIVQLGDKDTWVILGWDKYKAVTQDAILFEHLGELFKVPNKGYICRLQEDKDDS